jgi:hypothetical protein
MIRLNRIITIIIIAIKTTIRITKHNNVEYNAIKPKNYIYR